MTIAAIETRYAGCRFRSRLEARWAVFFDDLGIRWEYEPQGFETPSGRYLPDFSLDLGAGGSVWFEVKPDTDDDTIDPRWEHVVTGTKKPLILARGLPDPRRDIVWGSQSCNGWLVELFPATDYDDADMVVCGWDNGRAFCICIECRAIGIQFEGRSERMPCHPRPDLNKVRTGDHVFILDAYNTARAARFEFGEEG